VVSQGDVVNVKVIEIDADRRRLSLSLKRVEEGEPVRPRADGEPLAANLDLSEDVFGDAAAAPAEDVEVADEPEIAEGSLTTVPEVEEPQAEAAVEAPAEAEAEAEPEAVAEPEAEAVAEPEAEAQPDAEAEPPPADEAPDEPS
jgi:small subunit ribosomal protein S1